jgi:hypothetical protein
MLTHLYRSTSRTTNGQRFALNDVEAASVKQTADGPYYFYEHLSQGSPTMVEYTKETYRHAYAVSTVRPGTDGTPYLYTLNMSCRQEMWADLSPLFKQSVEGFKLLPTTNQYIPPDQVRALSRASTEGGETAGRRFVVSCTLIPPSSPHHCTSRRTPGSSSRGTCMLSGMREMCKAAASASTWVWR